MKMIATAAAMLLATGAIAQPPRHDYPSCDLATQRQVKGETGGAIRDMRQAHISVRANVLQADIGSARKARRLSAFEGNKLWQRVDAVRRESSRLVARQGFLSAAERAGYDRALDAIATRICR